jgi:hypothetical protein
MSQNITPDKLKAFTLAVMDAAHMHLGANGVKGVVIGLDVDTYYRARMEYLRDPNSMGEVDLMRDNMRNGFTLGDGLVRVVMVERHETMQVVRGR